LSIGALAAVVPDDRQFQFGQAIHNTAADPGNIHDRPHPVLLTVLMINVPHRISDNLALLDPLGDTNKGSSSSGTFSPVYAGVSKALIVSTRRRLASASIVPISSLSSWLSKEPAASVTRSSI